MNMTREAYQVTELDPCEYRTVCRKVQSKDGQELVEKVRPLRLFMLKTRGGTETLLDEREMQRLEIRTVAPVIDLMTDERINIPNRGEQPGLNPQEFVVSTRPPGLVTKRG